MFLVLQKLTKLFILALRYFFTLKGFIYLLILPSSLAFCSYFTFSQPLFSFTLAYFLVLLLIYLSCKFFPFNLELKFKLSYFSRFLVILFNIILILISFLCSFIYLVVLGSNDFLIVFYLPLIDGGSFYDLVIPVVESFSTYILQARGYSNATESDYKPNVEDVVPLSLPLVNSDTNPSDEVVLRAFKRSIIDCKIYMDYVKDPKCHFGDQNIETHAKIIFDFLMLLVYVVTMIRVFVRLHT